MGQKFPLLNAQIIDEQGGGLIEARKLESGIFVDPLFSSCIDKELLCKAEGEYYLKLPLELPEKAD